MKRNTIMAIMITFCFTASIFMIIPIRSANSPYNPWIDSNDDGKLGLQDLVLLANSYGTNGTPLTKASVQYDSGWMNVTDDAGQYITVVHNMSSTDYVVDITGKTTPDGDVLQMHPYPVVISNRTYGGLGRDQLNRAIQAENGTWILCGYTDSYGAGYYDGWLVKIDASGNVQWNKTYGGPNDDMFSEAFWSSDGNYVIVGTFGMIPPDQWYYGDFWLVKVDGDGNVLFDRTYGGADAEIGWYVIETNDTGYLMSGLTGSYGAGGYDNWLVKTDSNGNPQWNETYGGAGYERAYLELIQTSDGGYAFGGVSDSFSSSYDYYLVKTDENGTLQWQKTYGGPGNEEANGLCQTADGGYIMVGHTTSYGAGLFDMWLVKTDSNGTMQWSKTYGGAGDDWGSVIIQTQDGGYAITGQTYSTGNGFDGWLVKTDQAGDAQWILTLGGTDNEATYSVILTEDGNYLVAGTTGSFGAGNLDGWLLEIHVGSGLTWIASTVNSITLYRDTTDPYWKYVRVRIWKPKTP